MILAPTRRAWVLAADLEGAGLTEMVRSRLEVLRRCAWAPASSDLYWKVAVPMLLGRLGSREGAALFAQECMPSLGEDKFRNTAPAMILLQLAMLYFNRIGATRPQVGVWLSPNRIKTGYVHFLDFTAEELTGILEEADKAHGISYCRDLFRQMSNFEGIEPPPMGKSKAGPEHPMYFESERMGVSMQEEFYRLVAGTKPSGDEMADVAKGFERAGQFHTPEFIEWQQNALLGALKGVKIDEAALDQYQKEHIISLSRGDRQKGVEELAAAKLAGRATAKASPEQARAKGHYAETLEALEPPRNPPPNKQSDPDRVYRTYEQALAALRFLERITKDVKKPETVYETAKKDWPTLPRDKFMAMAQELRTASCSEVAVIETARVWEISESYCQEQIKDGAKTAKINAVWKAFFDDPACPFTVPADLKLRPENRYMLERVANIWELKTDT